MAKCKKCGANITKNEKFCPECGAELEETLTQNQKSNSEPDVETFSKEDVDQNKVVAVLSYLSILVLVPIFATPKSKYAHFHASQGVNLLLLEIIHLILSAISNLFTTTKYAYGVVYKSTPWFITTILILLGLAITILMIIGIINAASGKAKKLPIIGGIKIIK